MNIFNFRRQLIDDYSSYTRSFIEIRDPRIRDFVDGQLNGGVLWPESLIELNPSFEDALRDVGFLAQLLAAYFQHAGVAKGVR